MNYMKTSWAQAIENNIMTTSSISGTVDVAINTHEHNIVSTTND
jgi:hypothetical protein